MMDMFGCKRGHCRGPKKGPACDCVVFTPRNGLFKTEGLGNVAMAACSVCGHDNLCHVDLGRWKEGEPQQVDAEGKKWCWKMVIEGGGVAKSKKIQME